MNRYIAFAHTSPAGGHGISFPDFPGCVAIERDLERAVNAAARALRLHVEGMIEEHVPVPEPRSLAQIKGDAELTEELASARLVLIPLVPRDWRDQIAVEPVEEAPKSPIEIASTTTPGDGAAPRASAPKPMPPPTSLMGRRAGRVLARRIVDSE